MHKEHVHNFVALSLAVLVSIASIPLSTEALFRSQHDDGTRLEVGVPDVQKAAKADTTDRRLRAREYHKAIELYRDRLKRGEMGLVKPDINDPATVDFYLQKAEEEAEHSAAPKRTDVVTAQNISDDDRLLLRRYERAGYCPESLKNYVSGFFELCVKLAGSKLKSGNRTGILNDLIKARSRTTLPNTLKNRLEMLRQAREGTKRESTAPMRTSAPTN
ncbi:hypothetical protein A2706_02400 [Candidatus Peribacteria bacterium RIFCSPHIGHO2_01_FULL_51_35]|nr:MAG: hypothetical protein A2706_02400 [Candidatus Peribacteria bacterium RIFCSPHIGHO2_01_FULL_51_35]